MYYNLTLRELITEKAQIELDLKTAEKPTVKITSEKDLNTNYKQTLEEGWHIDELVDKLRKINFEIDTREEIL
jgi:hypothetical protein